jgi:hypothetical protein
MHITFKQLRQGSSHGRRAGYRSRWQPHRTCQLQDHAPSSRSSSYHHPIRRRWCCSVRFISELGSQLSNSWMKRMHALQNCVPMFEENASVECWRCSYTADLHTHTHTHTHTHSEGCPMCPVLDVEAVEKQKKMLKENQERLKRLKGFEEVCVEYTHDASHNEMCQCICMDALFECVYHAFASQSRGRCDRTWLHHTEW